MEIETFKNGIGELFDYFRTAPPKNEVIETWYEKSAFIPKEAVQWIIDQIETLDNIPRNIPREFKTQWSAYQKAHKEKISRLKAPCKECGGTGLLHFTKIEKNYNQAKPMKIHYVALCARCENYKEIFGSRLIEGGVIAETGMPVPKTLRTTIKEIKDSGCEFLEIK